MPSVNDYIPPDQKTAILGAYAPQAMRDVVFIDKGNLRLNQDTPYKVSGFISDTINPSERFLIVDVYLDSDPNKKLSIPFRAMIPLGDHLEDLALAA